MAIELRTLLILQHFSHGVRLWAIIEDAPESYYLLRLICNLENALIIFLYCVSMPHMVAD